MGEPAMVSVVMPSDGGGLVADGGGLVAETGMEVRMRLLMVMVLVSRELRLDEYPVVGNPEKLRVADDELLVVTVEREMKSFTYLRS